MKGKIALRLLSKRGERIPGLALLVVLCICSLVGSGVSGSVAQGCTITVSAGSSIQEAVDAAPAGAVVCLAPGTWEENIVVKKALTLRGVGPDKSVINGLDWNEPVILIAAETEIKVTIESLTITLPNGIELSGSAQARIINSTVFEIELSSLSWAEITSSTVENSIRLLNSARAKIADSTISGGYGIELSDSAQVRIVNSTVSGIELSGFSGVEIASSTIEKGIRLLNSAQAKITGSTISKNGEYSIKLSGSAQARIVNSTVSRIELSSFSGVEIASSTVEGSISLSDSAQAKIADSTRGYGVELSGSAQVRITNSTLSWIGLSGLSWVEIASSTVENSIRLSDSAQAKITDSTISKNGGYGVELSGSAQARIINSTFSRIELSGFSWAEIAGSTIETTIGDGIKLSDSAQIEVTTSIIIKKKHIDVDDGIKLLGSTQAKITDSTISNWSGGINLSDSARVEITGSTISENTFGISLHGSAQADITNSVISKNKFSISLGDSAQARITNSMIFENFIITVDGRQAGGIGLSNSARAEITNSTISRNGSGIDLSDQAQAKITNSIISENRFGINFYGSAQAEITTSTISENEVSGIVLFHSAQAKITNSTISRNGQDGIVLLYSAQATISGSIISKNRHGIRLPGSAQATISGSTISENLGDGIWLYGSPQVAIIGNEINNNRSYGVALSDCYNKDFIFTGRVSGRGNKIYNNAKGDVCPSELQFLMAEGAQPANQSPVASFSFTPVSPKAGDEVTFDASASRDPDGSIVSYRWDFGDGVEGTGKIVKHVFAQEGTYTVTLTVTDNSGLSRSLSQEVTISKAAEGPESPSQSGQALNVTFLKVYYGDTDFGEQLILHLAIKNISQETQYLFGAPGGAPLGNTMYVQDSEGRVYYPRSLLGFAFPIVPGQTIENEFPFPVPKTATGLKLYLRTSTGWESFPISQVGPEQVGVVADFTFTPATPKVNEEVTFDASASYSPVGKLVSYSWDFGDGAIAEGTIVQHAFVTEGSYIVTLKVVDERGSVASVSKCLVVNVILDRAERMRQAIGQLKGRSADIKVTVDKKEYSIATLRQKLDPEALEPIGGTDPITVYLDICGNPVSDPEVARKIGLIELARALQGMDSPSQRVEDLAAIKEYTDRMDKALLVWGIIGLKTPGDELQKLLKSWELHAWADWYVNREAFVQSLEAFKHQLVALKKAAETRPPAHLLTKMLVWVLEKVFGNPGEDAKHFLKNYINQAISSYEEAAKSSAAITDDAEARRFLHHLYLGDAYAKIASQLGYQIYGYNLTLLKIEVVEKVVGRIPAGQLLTALLEFPKLVDKALQGLNWTMNAVCEAAKVPYQVEAETKYKLNKSAIYTLELANGKEGASRYIHQYNRDYSITSAEGDKEAENCTREILTNLLPDPGKIIDQLKRFLASILSSPGELRVYDSEGRITGVIHGEVKEEIPNSFYSREEKALVILDPADTYKYEVQGTGEGSYNLVILKGQEGGVKRVSVEKAPISPGVVHQYSVDWEVLDRGERGVTVQIDQDSDGVFERVVLAGNEVTGGEIGGKPAWWPLLVLILIVLALSLSIVVYQASRGKSLAGRSS